MITTANNCLHETFIDVDDIFRIRLYSAKLITINFFSRLDNWNQTYWFFKFPLKFSMFFVRCLPFFYFKKMILRNIKYNWPLCPSEPQDKLWDREISIMGKVNSFAVVYQLCGLLNCVKLLNLYLLGTAAMPFLCNGTLLFQSNLPRVLPVIINKFARCLIPYIDSFLFLCGECKQTVVQCCIKVVTKYIVYKTGNIWRPSHSLQSYHCLFYMKRRKKKKKEEKMKNKENMS